MMKIVCYSQAVRPDVVDEIAAEAGVHVAADADALAQALVDADGLVIQDLVWNEQIAALAQNAAKLRWIQLLTSGYDNVSRYGAPEGVAVTNARGAFSPAVAVHAVALYLALLRNVPQMVAQKAARAWDRSFAGQIITPAETKIMIAGFGSIGEEIAHLLKPFAPWIVGASRSGHGHYLADEMVRGDEIHARLPEMDALFLSLPLTDVTRNIIDADALASMKPGALIVNVGRGGLIDSLALADALKSGAIAGAALDVTDPEPLPPDDPLWDAPNLIVSPHVAGAAGVLGARRQAEAATHNIRRFHKGEALENVVKL